MKKYLVLAVAVILGLGSQAQAGVWKEGQTLKIGHRGARGLVDENTLESIAKAIEMGVDTIEFDVQRSSDRVYVVIHDPTVDRTYNGKGLVEQMTLAQLKQLKTAGGYPMPTLEELFALLQTKKDLGIIMDIKVKGEDAIPDLYALVEKYGLGDRMVYETSYPKIAKAIEKFNPDLVSAIYPAFAPSAIYYAKKYRLDSVSIYYPFASKWMLDQARKGGFKFVVWTVNDEKNIDKFGNRLKVDGIMTDDPGLFKALSKSSCGCQK
jgi:glycerophosphoryl diester phosphodiesterase